MKRVAVVGFFQETNTFNPRLATERDFSARALLWGEEVFQARDSFGELAGALVGLGVPGFGIDPIPVGFFWGAVGGRIDDTVADMFEREMSHRLASASPLDGVLMLLHGASASASTDDLEGRFLGAARQVVGSQVPIGVALDHHANLTKAMVDNSSFLVGHRTEPHDPRDTAYRVATILGQLLVGELQVAQSWRKIPMLTHQENFETSSGPMNAWFSAARAAELRPGIHAASPFPVQPWLDVTELGWAVAVVADSFDQADQVAGELSLEAWDLRDQFSETKSSSIDQAMKTIRSDSGSQVLLHDMGDSLYAGSTGESTLLLERLLEERFSRKCFVPLVAPAIVGHARTAGIGNWIELPLEPPDTVSTDKPSRIRALVSGLDSGRIKVKGLVGQTSVDEGFTALLRIDDVFVHVTEIAGAAGADPNAYTRYGLSIPDDAVLVQKIAAAYPGFTADRQIRIQVNTPGLTQSNLSGLPWLRAPRPLYGLDPEATYPPIFK